MSKSAAMTEERPPLPNQSNSLLSRGTDIKILGILFVLSGGIDFFWILSYPEYSLKVFGTTFDEWAGALVKYQHPVIHWIIGYGFWNLRRWSFWGYLAYLGLACLSETINQVVLGFNSTRTTMIIVSLLFGTYIVARRHVFDPKPRITQSFVSQ
jgi:uncharacterized membrane protein (DUF2068 family)